MRSKTRTDALREAYAARFGPLFESDASYGGYQVLSFWARSLPMTYASLGARPAEVTLSCAVPFPELKDAVAELAGRSSELSPLTLLPYRIERTPFEGLLIVPREELAPAVPVSRTPARDVYRAVPVTGSELSLGLDAPERLHQLLCAAGALVVDPLRDCVLEPEVTRRFWKTARPLLLADERRRLRNARVRRSYFEETGYLAVAAEHEARMIAMREALIEHVERSGTSDELALAMSLGLDRIFAELADIGTFSLFSSVDMETLSHIRSFLMLMVRTHPEAWPLLLRTFNFAPEPWSPEETIEIIVTVLVDLYPQARREPLLTRAREALARDAVRVPGSGSAEGHAWSRLCEAVYLGLCDVGGPLDEALATSIAATARAAPRLEPAPDEAAAPDARLGRICQRLGLEVQRRLDKPRSRIEH